MWIGLGWIIGCYAASIIIVHTLYWLRRFHLGEPVRILLVTRNNGLHIESVIRSLFFVSGLNGRSVEATILDDQSTDDTKQIIERLSHYPTFQIDQLNSSQYPSMEDGIHALSANKAFVIHVNQFFDKREIPNSIFTR
jgi:hypothetical protein